MRSHSVFVLLASCLVAVQAFSSRRSGKWGREAVTTTLRAKRLDDEIRIMDKFVKKAIMAGVLLLAPLTAQATPLGEHTTCAWPACVSQADILKEQVPTLVSQAEKDEQMLLLKDIEFTLKGFPYLLEQKDYTTMRSTLRSSPAGALRLTCRKVKTYMEPAQRELFNKAYSRMIDDVDQLDSLTGKRLQSGSSDEAVQKAIDTAISSYSAFLSTVIIPPSPVPTATPQIQSSDFKYDLM